MTQALRTTILLCDNLSSVKVSPTGTDWVTHPCGHCLWLFVMDMVIQTQVTAQIVHICGTSTGHWTPWLCAGGKMLEQITTLLLRDLWAKPCYKEQKWQVWETSQTQKQVRHTGSGLDRSLKHIKGSPASWHIYISQDWKITLLKELMAQGYFLLASNLAHKILALSNLKRSDPEVKISMTPL